MGIQNNSLKISYMVDYGENIQLNITKLWNHILETEKTLKKSAKIQTI